MTKPLPDLNGYNERDTAWLARKWAEAVLRDPPPSGDFLAADLESIARELDRRRESNNELLAALKGVVAIADRRTDEFDRARAAIAKAEQPVDGELSEHTEIPSND